MGCDEQGNRQLRGLRATTGRERALSALRGYGPRVDNPGLAAIADTGASDRAWILLYPAGGERIRPEAERSGEEYYAEGTKALGSQHRAGAVDALENALVYSHGNFEYELKLTDALLASGATDEALAQLHGFLEQRPGDAEVNLKLARLEVRRKDVDKAWKYYQAAIGGVWPEIDPFQQRNAVRFEEAEYLVEQGRTGAAEAALVALSDVLRESWPEQSRLAELFLRNGDAERALKIYEAEVLRDRNGAPERRGAEKQRGASGGLGSNVAANAGRAEAEERYEAALLGAAKADFSMGNVGGAKRWLIDLPTQSDESRAMLAQVKLVEALDPFAEESSAVVRARRTVGVFQIAIGRLARCEVPFAVSMSGRGQGSAASQTGTRKGPENGYGTTAGPPAAGAGAPAAGAEASQSGTRQQTPLRPQALAEQWNGLARWAEQLSPLMNERKLRGRDDVIESTMRFAFQAEMMAQKDCVKASPEDEALLLLARERLGAKQ